VLERRVEKTQERKTKLMDRTLGLQLLVPLSSFSSAAKPTKEYTVALTRWVRIEKNDGTKKTARPMRQHAARCALLVKAISNKDDKRQASRAVLITDRQCVNVRQTELLSSSSRAAVSG